LDDGSYTRSIEGFTGLSEVFVLARYEALGNGSARKVLYVFDGKHKLGVLSKAIRKCVVAEMGPEDADFTIWRDAVTLSGHTPKQQRHLDFEKLRSAVNSGLGKRVRRGSCEVNHYNPEGRDPSLASYIDLYHLDRKPIQVFKFDGHPEVHYLAREVRGPKEDQIMVYFFPDKTSSRSGENLIKVAIIAKRRVKTDGKKEAWQPLSTPEVAFTDSAEGCQFSRIFSKQLELFLLEEEQTDGASINLPPQIVYTNRSIHLCVGGKIILITGVAKYIGEKLPGKVIRKGNQKLVYLWKTILERDGDPEQGLLPQPPLFAKGQAVAEVEDGSWEIIERKAPDERRIRLAETVRFGNYLFSGSSRVVPAVWPITDYSRSRLRHRKAQRKLLQGQIRREATKWMRGHPFRIPIPSQVPGNDVYSVTRLVEKRFRFTEFWPIPRGGENHDDFTMNTPPFDALFLVRLVDGNWQPFEARLTEHEKFIALIASGEFRAPELKEIFANEPHFRIHHLVAIDDLIARIRTYVREANGK